MPGIVMGACAWAGAVSREEEASDFVDEAGTPAPPLEVSASPCLKVETTSLHM